MCSNVVICNACLFDKNNVDKFRNISTGFPLPRFKEITENNTDSRGDYLWPKKLGKTICKIFAHIVEVQWKTQENKELRHTNVLLLIFICVSILIYFLTILRAGSLSEPSNSSSSIGTNIFINKINQRIGSCERQIWWNVNGKENAKNIMVGNDKCRIMCLTGLWTL